MLEFILERYNYWISICLMLTGLYIVISRGNLVKTLIGLNLFQTSVFIFYISIGKIAGATAPILLKQDQKGGHHGDGHGGEHDGDHGDGHSEKAAHGDHADAAHASKDYPAGSNDLNAVAGSGTDHENADHDALHGVADHAGAGNSVLVETKSANDGYGVETHTDLHAGPETHTEAADATVGVASKAYDLADVVYTNPLPHVLILTAIVVGVATTAVGLSLAVRIREAYGTIEEDELEMADLKAEFGDDLEADGVIA